jgi:hypothetical protein
MGRRMTRGKQQILFNYLPGRTFDFERIATIARVKSVRGTPSNDLNPALLLRKLGENARAWEERFRPGLRDDILNDPSRFVFLDPVEVQAEMFPKVLWCQNRPCGRVLDFTQRDRIPNDCPICRTGRLIQMRFVRIHRCGALEPLLPPKCQRCKTGRHMALDTRGSERFTNFLWKCSSCQLKATTFPGQCRQCQWPGDPRLRNMDIEVHRAGRTYYAHTAVLLNTPHREFDAFFSLREWPFIAAAKFLGFPEVATRKLTDFSGPATSGTATEATGLTGDELEQLMARQAAGELSAEQLLGEMKKMRQQKSEQNRMGSPAALSQAVVERTGVAGSVWERAGHPMLEAVLHHESGNTENLLDRRTDALAANLAASMGLAAITLVSEFPIITATYGYSRADYTPQECRLNPFPPERQEAGKLPIFVDQVQADALLLKLDEERVIRWLVGNGFPPTIPNGRDPQMSLRAFPVSLFDNVPLYQSLQGDSPQARLIFGLLHTLSHISVRRAALLCGLDHTSLSEYILPRALTCAIYCNHRFGATIGALTALFEQSASQWLSAVLDSTRCVYDPVCRDTVGSCHACTHLAETSCRFFNLNLSRSFLFGGPDLVLGNIRFGYFDRNLDRRPEQ